MSERKILRYSVVITQLLDATGIFTKTIYVPFIPDELRVVQLGLHSNGAILVTGLFSLNCDSLVGQTGSSLGFIVDGNVAFTGVKYPLTTSPNGTHTFRLLIKGAPTLQMDGAYLGVHLEFRKHI
jgi:hypothetical protein